MCAQESSLCSQVSVLNCLTSTHWNRNADVIISLWWTTVLFVPFCSVYIFIMHCFCNQRKWLKKKKRLLQNPAPTTHASPCRSLSSRALRRNAVTRLDSKYTMSRWLRCPHHPPKCHWRPDEVRKAEGTRASSTITTPIEETNRNKDNMSHETLHWKP